MRGSLWCRLDFVVYFSLLLSGASGCGSSQPKKSAAPEQVYPSTMNYLVGAAPEQAEKLAPLWVSHQKTEESLRKQYAASSEQLFGELEKLDKKTVDEAKPLLDAAQSKRLEEVFSKRRAFERESIDLSQKTAVKLEEQDRNRPPPPPKKPAEKGNSGGVSRGGDGPVF